MHYVDMWICSSQLGSDSGKGERNLPLAACAGVGPAGGGAKGGELAHRPALRSAGSRSRPEPPSTAPAGCPGPLGRRGCRSPPMQVAADAGRRRCLIAPDAGRCRCRVLPTQLTPLLWSLLYDEACCELIYSL